ncbi:MAG: hypothetical protein HZC22_02295 [Rhodocyclales bacterium]|nr:hypothetical protein [Rhodocyclales bacterium]
MNSPKPPFDITAIYKLLANTRNQANAFSNLLGSCECAARDEVGEQQGVLPVEVSPSTPPPMFRVLSIHRLPGARGSGVCNFATIFHERMTLDVTWWSHGTDPTLRRDNLVCVEWRNAPAPSSTSIDVAAIAAIDAPSDSIDLFATIPARWLDHPVLFQPLRTLWAKTHATDRSRLTDELWDGRQLRAFLRAAETYLLNHYFNSNDR